MCVSVCVRAHAHMYACMCKYVLMGPLIKTPGVSAICQHWSIGRETDSSLCACVCVCVHMRTSMSVSVFSASSRALCLVIILLVTQTCHTCRNGISHLHEPLHCCYNTGMEGFLRGGALDGMTHLHTKGKTKCASRSLLKAVWIVAPDH